MTRTLRQLSAKTFVVAALGIFLFGVFAVLVPQKALAAGESYRWSDNSAITASGGDLRSDAQFTSIGSNNSVFFATVQHKTGCQFTLRLTAGPLNNSGTLAIPQSVGGTPLPNLCSTNIRNSYSGKTVQISGQRPTAGDKEETPLEKATNVTVYSPSPANASPPQVVITIKDASGNSKGTRILDQQTVDRGEDTAAAAVYYDTSTGNKNFTLDPGKYSICFDAIIKQCQNFTKVKYQNLLLKYGENLSARDIEVTVEIHYLPPPEDTQIGPVPLVLNQGGGQVAATSTDTFSYIPTSAEKDEASSIGSPSINNVFTLRGQFGNVNAGIYQVCIPTINVCKDVAKETDLDAKVTLVVQGDNAEKLVLNTLDDEEKPVCEISTTPLSWLICPVYNMLSTGSDWILQNILVPFLKPTSVGLNPNDKATGATFTIWSTFRVYGNIILVILLLVAIIGQTINGGVMEAYTARKMLPRILIAAILINVSIYLVAFAIDLSNVIGNGIADLITAPLVQTGQFKFNASGTQVFAIGAIGGTLIAVTTFLASEGTLLAILPFILLFVVLPAFLALLGAFITLILLQALIMVLVISSPVAFALYCLPNTEKYFHTWWDWLLRALLVYPIFMTIIAISDVFTVVIQRANGIGT